MWKWDFPLHFLQYKYREAFLRDRGQRIGFLSANDDPKIRHVLRVGKLQSDLQYRNDYALNMGQFQSHLNQPGFLHAKRSQQLASNVNYRQPLHQYTCDPEQLNVKHAKQAYNLQSDVSVAERHSPSMSWEGRSSFYLCNLLCKPYLPTQSPWKNHILLAKNE